MHALPAIAIFDIGRTNKKQVLFDAQYRVLEEKNIQLPETTDEDGFPSEDLQLLATWVRESFAALKQRKDLELKAVNVSAYGASFVHLSPELRPLTPLYNYLKPFPAFLQEEFDRKYNNDGQLGMQTASPQLGHLNSGMQLYWLKKQSPEIYRQIRYSLHLPQWLSFLLSGVCASELTSIGCHTRLWDFEKQDYHKWVIEEGLKEKFPIIRPGTNVIERKDGIMAGVGLHDSSSALIPYLSVFNDPFVLLSTGTWSVSLNPFNHSSLTDQELKQDCLCYLSLKGEPIKASRLYAGKEHELFTKKLADQFQCAEDYFLRLKVDSFLVEKWFQSKDPGIAAAFADPDKSSSYEEAYLVFMINLVRQQKKAINLVLEPGGIEQIFVDGGFSKNPFFMNLLALSFPEKKIFAASLAHASALGAALGIHSSWNTGAIPAGLLSPVQIS
jgi:sugar (pentulose or hexulose) kinase